MPLSFDNIGSAARDWCMLERNLLSHLKLSLLLSLLSWAVLLHARISDSIGSQSKFSGESVSTLPLSLTLFVSALVSLFSGVWEYIVGMRDLESKRAFLAASRPHAVIFVILSGLIFSTCVLLLADKSFLDI